MPIMPPKSRARRFLSNPYFHIAVLLMPIVWALAAGGPARADGPSDIVRQLDRIAESLRELARREPIKVVCECRQ